MYEALGLLERRMLLNFPRFLQCIWWSFEVGLVWFGFTMEMENKECILGWCLIQKILVWVPVVSLLRFKAVCKSWRELIQSPFFIDFHTTTSTSTTTSSSKFGSFIIDIFWRMIPPQNSSTIYDIKGQKHELLILSSQSNSESESGGGGGDEEEWPAVVVDLGFDDMSRKSIVGSCNGLVCVRDRNDGSKPDQLYLLNPATRQFMILPPQSKTNLRATFILVGFGFDVETKDYKVVQFTGLKSKWNGNGPDRCFCEVQVYTLSTHSWRHLEGIPCLPGYPFQMPDSVLYLNGTCFFMAHFFYTKRYPCLAKNNRFIISFDFTKEIITPIQLPDHHRDQELCLCSWGGGGDKIALFTSPDLILFRDDSWIGYWEDINMWVLNYERGSSSSSVNKKSWTILYSFQMQLKSQNEWYVPRGISNDGKFALLESGYGNKMNLYNFATKEVKNDFLYCKKVKSKAHAYKPSLVSVIGGNGAGRSQA